MGPLPLVGASAVVGAGFKDCRFAAMCYARATLWAVEKWKALRVSHFTHRCHAAGLVCHPL